jgi:hypothetical protein
MTEGRRITFALTERSERALALSVELGKDNQTDTVNRAIQYYSYLLFLREHRNAVIKAHHPDGNVEIISMML